MKFWNYINPRTFINIEFALDCYFFTKK